MVDDMAMYNEKVMEHFMHPQNVGEIEDASGSGTYGSPVCGDMMKIDVKIDENDVITEAKFKTFGCGSAIADLSFIKRSYRYDNRKDGRRSSCYYKQTNRG